MDLLYYYVFFIVILEVKCVQTRKSRISSNVFHCNNRVGLIADPHDCTKFYQCDHNVAHHKVCTGELVFNDKIFVCDWLRNVPRCQEPIPKPFRCPEPNGQFRNPDDCSTYYNCWNNNAVLSHCQNQLYFNQERHYCDWPENVLECQKKVPPVPKLFSCPLQHGHFNNPDDCTTFYFCEDNHATLVRCPKGLYFNQRNIQCELSENVPECKNTEDLTNILSNSLTIVDELPTSTVVPIHQEESTGDVITKGLKWLSQQRGRDYGWKSDTPYALQIHQFDNLKWFNDTNLESQIIVRQYHIQLLEKILRDPYLITMPLKDLAMEISVLIGICGNPYDFHGVDLISLLKMKMDAVVRTMSSLKDRNGYPLAVIALCQFNITIDDHYLQPLFEVPIKIMGQTTESQSLMSLALVCIMKQSLSLINPKAYLDLKLEYILEQQSKDGRFPSEDYNTKSILSTALAAQVLKLTNTGTKGPLQKAMDYLRLNQNKDGSFEGGIESLHSVISVFKGLTILDLNSSRCNKAMTTPLNRDDRPEGKTPPADFTQPSQIKLKYTIIDTVYKGFNISKYFIVPTNKNFYTILQMIAIEDERFRFDAVNTELGHLIKSVHNLEEDKNNSNYWFIYRAKPGEKMKLDDSDGLEKIFPVNEEEIFLIYEHFIFET